MVVEHRLFGGAITASLDGAFIDASELRQVPDNQEVLLSRDSDVSVIVEVLQCVEPRTDKDGMHDAVRFHFASLAHDNAATDAHVETVDAVACEAPGTATPPPSLLAGTQVVRKFGKASETDTVRIYVALWRLPSKNVDLVLSINDPAPSRIPWDAAHRAAHSLRIADWGLFA